MQILIKNGRVWDGEKFFFADVLTDGPVISRIEPGISCEKAYLFDATGKIVSAGLVDCHMHMLGLSGAGFAVQTEIACFPFGVTAAIDAGSCLGDRALLEHISVKNAVFSDGKTENGHINRQVAEENLRRYGDKAIGIKLFFDDTSKNVWDSTPLLEACAFAREKQKKLLVHCNNSPIPMAQIVEQLAPGDVLTHVYHGGKHTCQEEDYAAFKLAREKGVTMDAGFAANGHTDFGVFQGAVAAGFLPDTISTDITAQSAYQRGGRYGLTMCMSMARAAGMEEADIFRAVTSAPAKAHGQSWGCLEVGGAADIAVLEYGEEGFSLKDKAGNRLESRFGYRCKLTVLDGKIVYRD